jgi:predicted  nucleic acid-binding Zn-ribbon protein
VQPTRWEQTADRGHWRLWRRCPECGWRCHGVHGEREIDAYDEDLDRGTEALADELKARERENMEWIADTFASALAADLISADDFS